MKNLLTFLLLSVQLTHAQTLSHSAWRHERNDTVTVLLFADRYFSQTSYDLKNKKFISTMGGVWKTENGHMEQKLEFHSGNPAMVGSLIRLYADIEDHGKMRVNTEENPSDQKLFTLIDEGKPGALTGAWVITGRMQNDAMQEIIPGDRQTLKLLSGTRFQWIAFNKKTGEFFGTGGGTYTTANGKYTENLEFFSRDNSRVGASLQFDFSVNGDQWNHKGLSSKGDPIDEVWSKKGI